MSKLRIVRSVIGSVLCLALGTTAASAEDLCLTGLGFVFRLNFQQFAPFSGTSSGPITGRVTGGAPCGTLGGGIPLTGSANVDGTNLNLGFLMHAVSIPDCGSVETKVVLSLSTLSGRLDLWNSRMGFENTGTVTATACPVSATNESLPVVQSGTRDAAGNIQR
jgi:hypothetical protein